MRSHAEQFVTEGIGSLRSWVITRLDESGKDGSGKDEAPVDGVGTAAIHHVDNDGQAEAGYWVAPWARRQGAAVWALEAIRSQARAMGRITMITLTIAEQNLASRRTAERAGYRTEPGDLGTAVDSGIEVAAVRYRLTVH